MRSKADRSASSIRDEAQAKRTLRLIRPAGAAIVIELPESEAVQQYFTDVEAWFAKRGGPTLFAEATTAKDLRQEYADFITATETNPRLKPPADAAIRLDLGEIANASRTANLPPPVRDEHYPTNPGLERRAITTYVVALADERFATETGLAVQHTEGDAVAEVELRPRQGRLDPAALSEVSEIASRLTPVDDDVLDILLSNAALNAPNDEGLYTIEIDAILDARQRGIKTKAESGKSYLAGRQQKLRDDVLQRIRHLESLYLSLGERRMRGKTVREYDRVVTVRRLLTDPATQDERVIGVRYQLSSKLTDWLDSFAVVPRKLLELDGRNRAPAKALGRYFFQRAKSAGPDGYIQLRVGDVLGDLRRTTIDPTGRNSGRPRAALERDLEELVSASIFLDWGYVETNGSRNADSVFKQSYKVAEAWLNLTLRVKLPSPTPPEEIRAMRLPINSGTPVT